MVYVSLTLALHKGLMVTPFINRMLFHESLIFGRYTGTRIARRLLFLSLCLSTGRLGALLSQLLTAIFRKAQFRGVTMWLIRRIPGTYLYYNGVPLMSCKSSRPSNTNLFVISCLQNNPTAALPYLVVTVSRYIRYVVGVWSFRKPFLLIVG